ncbi:MAG: hypothetical protein GFH27_549307n38 [Chloroflexi bacterium AL-W]|nr:hypothetical protein [Chloroflexi bacterium AL-N1]NOK69070.1 hypothetical protein [Chloroflexi bacterium AL-N10]NOK77053.1 hypothetical protein [Chloroflexi bacterium AL-N5]NOK83698.1 hypothetical protein [Chloroflexi bacterium AL-W]NOK90908.1 hypothetical protein [Chloroflexi bacterium AL-N15]
MSILDYFIRAFGAWFVGFFPLAEIYVAVPAAMAADLDDVSVIFWTVFGNYTPVLLIHFFYEELLRFDKIRNWLERLVSTKAEAQINKHGAWFILLITPWTGVWVMAVTAKVLKMNSALFLTTSFISVFVYAIAILVMINLGIDAFST